SWRVMLTLWSSSGFRVMAFEVLSAANGVEFGEGFEVFEFEVKRAVLEGLVLEQRRLPDGVGFDGVFKFGVVPVLVHRALALEALDHALDGGGFGLVVVDEFDSVLDARMLAHPAR